MPELQPHVSTGGRACPGGIIGYPLDALYEEVAFVAYHFHWPHGDVMTLEHADFAELGNWLREYARPVAAILEGGYSADLPELIDAFLSAWNT